MLTWKNLLSFTDIINFNQFSTYSDVENYIQKVINHIKYVSKNKPCPVKTFNYLQSN